MNFDDSSVADSLKEEGKLQQSIALYENAIVQNPNSPSAYYDLGKALQQNGQIAAAVACHQKAILLQPNFTAAYFPLMYAPLPKDSPLIDGLVALYREVIEILPNFPLAYINLAVALSKQGKIQESIALFQTAVRLQTVASRPELSQVKWNSTQLREPDFIIIGSPRCGTTSLYKYITSHPQILPAANKEICFFSEHFNKGLAWYQAHFPPPIDAHHFLTGEATPTYLTHPLAASRLHGCLPKVKLIVILRNPVDRALSHYQMLVRRGTESRTFEKAIDAELQLLADATETSLADKSYWKDCHYIYKSLYVCSLKQWMNLFPREQFLILQSEEFYANPAATLSQVFNFLDLPDYQLRDYKQYNGGNYQPANDVVCQRLHEYFQPHNRELAEYVQRDFEW
ncbi:MAG: sulfotransferase [Microcoleus sp. PH2017_01_SCD_O_A]|uniref:tetratricopeptide repeat-containing sulfotransferase family protein n=1 Tax=unclassified Microcoleus TaxID=2642155 RepID=UPI001DB36ED7|nr:MULTISPECIES: tetratricopeptide repeat protein [unclassified Microcoleus]MCC3503622.1 sulfotransferase [Microcoleus sp. PH2017_19_SFW_U_A]MCC3567937.1 sulfotransferase [Microcoleus sp. PH2017_31_RDM_U_A]TAF85209.1 MAG: tetratricopeptide repeat protein [Oscillatoriales cyanobacterium]MCC3425531.1 sulfotransferase [Microcoleus sp. PH2017_01_SCD_O_A]MCC3448681.1 sulfotransferase [Microcoleus sp. PH2017_09_SFU_O_A]